MYYYSHPQKYRFSYKFAYRPAIYILSQALPQTLAPYSLELIPDFEVHARVRWLTQVCCLYPHTFHYTCINGLSWDYGEDKSIFLKERKGTLGNAGTKGDRR
jgi:hypothetical protein